MRESKRTIFVIDGSQTNLWHLMQALGEEGYRVVVCARALTALRMLEDETPDAILINVADPLLRGYDLYRAIARERHLDQVPVLLMTRERAPQDGEAVPEAAPDLGRVSYIGLPLDRRQVLDQIRQGIGAGKREREAARRASAAQARLV